MAGFILTDIALGLFLIALIIFEIALFMDIFGEKYLIPGSPEFKEVLEREAKILGLEEKEILVECLLGKRGEQPAAAASMGDGTYYIRFWQSNTYNPTTIRHELYHIYAGHCDRGYGLGRKARAAQSRLMSWVYRAQDKLEYFAYQEIRANIYGLFGI